MSADAGPSQAPAGTGAGWVKSPRGPVLGGELGTCFDVCLLEENPLEGNDRLRMWFSWRPKKSIALVESGDGVRWSEPMIVLGPDERSGWEEDVNRPVVVRRRDGFHMWYTGQTRDPESSRIGHAVSPDGVSWRRHGSEPVVSPEEPWEKCAVMCPHVVWQEGAGKEDQASRERDEVPDQRRRPVADRGAAAGTDAPDPVSPSLPPEARR